MHKGALLKPAVNVKILFFLYKALYNILLKEMDTNMFGSVKTSHAA